MTYPWEDPEIAKHYNPKQIEILLNQPKLLDQYFVENPFDTTGLNEIDIWRNQVNIGFEYLRDVLKISKPIDSFKDQIKISSSSIKSFDGYEIPIKIYKLKGSDKNSLHVNYHGGGFSLGGGLNFDENYIPWLVYLTGVTIIDVDYRLIPENHYTVAFLDGFASIKYIIEHSDEYQIDKERISIGGASAGGHLVLALGHLLRDFNLKVKFILANVPPAENYTNHETVDTIILNESFKKFENSPDHSYATIKKFRKYFVQSEVDNPNQIIDNLDNIKKYFGRLEFLKDLQKYYQGDTYLSPNFEGLVPHVIITGENDTFSSSGLGYAKKLIDNFIPVQSKTIRGLGHGWLWQTNQFEEAWEGLQYIAKLIRDVDNNEFF
ncbi:hypothetical protein WICMUC_004286 [Wickerhamomyces mucosus]|uniref:Alpha/beta hydrolase fold-3 domain-containing protein n=1 Tax=Wickerhamomyces mucosus TaxID=1378264 RepID=A0A9P8PIL9_9ASCO|nr:hypothetical protein WICMUC_004286 [Wickerhamomyces mucosus]